MRMDTDKAGRLRLGEQLGVLSMSRKERTAIALEIGAQIRKLSKQNIASRRTVDGKTMEQRKQSRREGKNNRLMLRGLRRLMGLKKGRDGQADVTWKNPITAEIAYRHQHGGVEQSGSIKARREESYVKRKAPCPRWLAKELKRLGWQQEIVIRNKQGQAVKTIRKRRPLKWITSNMTRGEASVALYLLENRSPKEKWEIRTPARPFLGPKPGTENKFLNNLAREAVAKIKNR
ncbi:MAG: phage virion morphogenesis protein [Pseudodesulfovibrio sp.]|nr:MULTISPECIES: phage virion morphogenesis protein [Pseudodesulfovibrio]MBU4475226.1 phage virion morphogenesis protein [Pseudomonadota bacterium]MBU4516265.1 phage virion morphogenesis protein [Pseudomonadota bacterium]MBU4522444.1 phage virion morphogenesis protein [Pseudomonadota bacterium]MBU4558646.1 phage virion morphogenesis protein [Pseudomonadota bacterium]MBV1772567.1 phage virion morphogenesis protein [Pseudodesulfovibrio sp.]